MIFFEKINNYLNEKYSGKVWDDLVYKVSKECNWSSGGISNFVYDLMVNCNFHSEAKDILNMIRRI